MDKDKLLQEKDQKIQELTTKLMQKEQMVEMLRFQLEIRTNGELPESMVHVKVKQEPLDSYGSPLSLIHPPSPPFTPTEEMVTIKQEVIKEEVVSWTSPGVPQCAQKGHTCEFSQQQMRQKLLRPQECDIQKEERTNENRDRTLEDLHNHSEQHLKREIHQQNHDVTERQQTQGLLGHQQTAQVRTDPRGSISDEHEEQPAQEAPLKLSPLPFPGVSSKPGPALITEGNDFPTAANQTSLQVCTAPLEQYSSSLKKYILIHFLINTNTSTRGYSQQLSSMATTWPS